jgi:uncharacterized protein (TIGR00162 family)
MVCAIKIHEKPKLEKPILLTGLPGIGFVANIAALYLIQELKAKRFAEVISSFFPDVTVVTDKGEIHSLGNELYYYKRRHGGHDLLVWYGNTQAFTTFGQYELCGRVLEIVEDLGCRAIITLGGFKTDNRQGTPALFCAASDAETLNKAKKLGAKNMVGQILGITGLLIGLSKLRGLTGFSLLVETLGTYPDAAATYHALSTLNKWLKLPLDFSRLDAAAEKTRKLQEAFRLFTRFHEKKNEAQRFRWFV